MKTALICGASGQDGAYLAQYLLGKGYRVVGTMRNALAGDRSNLATLGIDGMVDMVALTGSDRAGVAAAVERVQPDEIYALWGQSSVSLSFSQPAETVDSVIAGTVNLLEALRLTLPSARLFHAGSGESFGDLRGIAATEKTPFRPLSPYAAAKASAQSLVTTYRNAYGLFAANAYLFNHESPLRPERFVTRKIAAAAHRIAGGSNERLRLGRTDIVRDWGWAPEYVEAMWRVLQQPEASDYIVATGRSVPLSTFIAEAFAAFDLDWREHIDHDRALMRPADADWSGADPGRAQRQLGWRAQVTVKQVAQRMCEAERAFR